MQERNLLKVYCEHGALTHEIRKWDRNGVIELVHFPYDPDSHTKKIPGIAAPSGAQIRDLNLPISDLPGKIGDYKTSEHFEGILSVIGKLNRRDALHIDTALKSGCSAFITQDSDILNHKTELEELLGIRFFDSNIELRDVIDLRTKSRAKFQIR